MIAKESSLNPLASTFIPSSVTGAATEAEVLNSNPEVFTTKSILLTSMTLDFTTKVLKYKAEHGEATITKCELLHLVLKLIVLHYNIRSRRALMHAVDFLEENIPSEPMNIKENGKSLKSSKPNPRTFDFSVYRIPAQSILLVAFYGLNRHEQAFKPMLSLAHRPKILRNKVWSLTDKDLKLWNPSIVQPCSCPPMFGYHIPADFFGNPFKFRNQCPKKQIHLSRSKDSSMDNEYILLEHALMETESVDFEKVDLDYYSNLMKKIVYSILSMLDTIDVPENVKNVTEDGTDEGYGSDKLDSLWNVIDPELDFPKIEQLNDDHHPLLKNDLAPEEPVKEISMEIRELLGKRFSVASSSCNPPCSAWCLEVETSNSIHKRKSDSSAIVLLNETTKFMTDISSGSETVRPAWHSKRSIKRSFSANDTDSWQSNKKFSSLKRDDFRSRRESYDSGIMSSHEEDAFCEDSEEVSSDNAPMWTMFSGEHSLWEPLPVPEQSKSTHRRVRDLKRQTSSELN